VVVYEGGGVANFERLQGRAHDGYAFLYAFDLLELDGTDVRTLPLDERKDRLRQLLRDAAIGIQFNEHVEGDGDQVFAHACKLGLEGVVSKDRTRAYRLGRTRGWLKIKNPQAPGVLRFDDRDERA
jgi:bifunctional non-homologous end joining protein LigD